MSIRYFLANTGNMELVIEGVTFGRSNDDPKKDDVAFELLGTECA